MSRTFTKRQRLPPKESREKLIKDVHSLIKVLREIFRNNRKLSASIDEAYEYLIEDQIRLIPNDWICGAYETCDMLKGMVMCLDFVKLNEVIQTRSSKVWFHMDCYNFIINDMFRALTDQGNTRAVLENLMQIFKPFALLIV